MVFVSEDASQSEVAPPSSIGHERQQRLQLWLDRPGNSRCFECGEELFFRTNAWYSLTYAISLCSRCAGIHRGVAHPASRVKSMFLDLCREEELCRLEGGGNLVFAEVLGPRDELAEQDEDEADIRSRIILQCSSLEIDAHLKKLNRLGSPAQVTTKMEAAVQKLRGVQHVRALLEKPEYFRTSRGGLGCSAGDHSGGHLRLLQIVRDVCLKSSRSLGVDTLHSGEADRTLHEAAECGDEEAVRCLLSSGCSVNDADAFGWTPLLYAVSFNRASLCKLLLENGADPDRQESGGCAWSPLQWACQKGHIRCVIVLLASGANPNGRPAQEHGKTPLALAAMVAAQRSSELYLATVQMLQKYFVDLRQPVLFDKFARMK
eukprot:CAMPEP_0178407740 /NCGR_PEP_ID=MMETSP0689_2-20121128/19583_1 /TAXON_ID=160604 /ORGANISM="Amphidinium massartii, Strain CS-259" /LENGTH=375 /DNA_ID=CAMNT_0020028821 /DNA_START=53 /DNA_END=1181 /DNA_ORIENTATION=+